MSSKPSSISEDLFAANQPIAVVTGANSGLGLQTVKVLARKRFKVIMACRNLEKATEAKNELLAKLPKVSLQIIALDLARFKSVYAFAEAFCSQYNRLDLLINNAGVMIPPYQKTEDGNELQWQVNYLSHFLLTGLLMDLLQQTKDSRVISLSSKAHEHAQINFKDINSDKGYSKWKAYGQSKLACLVFAKELDRRLKSKSENTISVAAHPGISNTQLFQYVPGWFQKSIGRLLTPLISHPPEKATKSILMAALSEHASGGTYYGPNGFQGLKGTPAEVEPAAIAKDKDLAKKLWEFTEERLGFKFFS